MEFISQIDGCFPQSPTRRPIHLTEGAHPAHEAKKVFSTSAFDLISHAQLCECRDRYITDRIICWDFQAFKNFSDNKKKIYVFVAVPWATTGINWKFAIHIVGHVQDMRKIRAQTWIQDILRQFKEVFFLTISVSHQ